AAIIFINTSIAKQTSMSAMIILTEYHYDYDELENGKSSSGPEVVEWIIEPGACTVRARRSSWQQVGDIYDTTKRLSDSQARQILNLVKREVSHIPDKDMSNFTSTAKPQLHFSYNGKTWRITYESGNYLESLKGEIPKIIEILKAIGVYQEPRQLTGRSAGR
ncbi:MAG: hypothetical protein KIT44_14835, partial [Opitutaceae bacterium]|nr:hypothetical protein [Opitutaceae bacterium]